MIKNKIKIKKQICKNTKKKKEKKNIILACFPTCFATNIFAKNKKEEKMDIDLKCITKH